MLVKGAAALCMKYPAFGCVKVYGLAEIRGLAAHRYILLYPQAASYLIDVKREENQSKAFSGLLILSFFPQPVQALNRYNDMVETPISPMPTSATVASGIKRLVWGYFKKLIVADRVAAAAALLFTKPEDYGGAYVLLGIILYAIQLYCDFTGGIDIALGLAKALGISMAENFDRPFLAQSVKEY